MKRVICMLVAAGLLIFVSFVMAGEWGQRVDSNNRQGEMYSKINLPAQVFTSESNTIRLARGASKLAIRISNSVIGTVTETVTLNTWPTRIETIKKLIDDAKIPALRTELTYIDSFTHLVLYVVGDSASIQIIDVNTETLVCTQTYSTQAQWQTGSSTYIDSTTVANTIQLDTGTAYWTPTGYSSCGTFTSAVYDRGVSDYMTLNSFTFTTCDSQSIGLETAAYFYRQGSTNPPTGSWTSITSGTNVTSSSRFVQWYVYLTTSETLTKDATPKVGKVTVAFFAYNPVGDTAIYKLGLDTRLHIRKAQDVIMADEDGVITKDNPLYTAPGNDSAEADTYHIGTGTRVQFVSSTAYVIDFVVFTATGTSETVTLTAQSGSETKCQLLIGVDGTSPTPWRTPVKCLTNGNITCPSGLKVYIKYRP